MFYPPARLNAKSNWDSCWRLIAKLPTCVAAFHRLRTATSDHAAAHDLGHAANSTTCSSRHEPLAGGHPHPRRLPHSPREHTITLPRSAGRVTGSTLANPYTVVSAAIGTLNGPCTGGANEEVLEMLATSQPREGQELARRRPSAKKRKIMGLRPPASTSEDPRARVAGAGRERLRPRRRAAGLLLALELEKAAVEVLGPKGSPPTVDFFSGIVYQSLGIRATVHPDLRHLPASPAGSLTGSSSSRTTASSGPSRSTSGKHNVAYVPLRRRPSQSRPPLRGRFSLLFRTRHEWRPTLAQNPKRGSRCSPTT